MEKLVQEMIRFDAGSPHRIQHFMKVHAFARHIAVLEGVDEGTQKIIEAAALTHDIGIRVCEEKYGRCNGKMQEQEGPAVADEMLTGLGYARALIDRVCYLIAHHHTYDQIEGIDYRILVEADFLVNLHEHGSSRETTLAAYERIFRTDAGCALLKTMFGLVP